VPFFAYKLSPFPHRVAHTPCLVFARCSLIQVTPPSVALLKIKISFCHGAFNFFFFLFPVKAPPPYLLDSPLDYRYPRPNFLRRSDARLPSTLPFIQQGLVFPGGPHTTPRTDRISRVCAGSPKIFLPLFDHGPTPHPPFIVSGVYP